jgi:predicted RNA binding protein with dsRBD fold (UPF0201 family)
MGNLEEITILYSCDDKGKWDKAVAALLQNTEFMAAEPGAGAETEGDAEGATCLLNIAEAVTKDDITESNSSTRKG